MEDVLWAIQSICPPQDAQQLKTACAALGIETWAWTTLLRASRQSSRPTGLCLDAPMSGFCDPAQRPL